MLASIIRHIKRCDVSMFLWVTSRSLRTQVISTAVYVSRTANGAPYLFLLLWPAVNRQAIDAEFLCSIIIGFIIERPIYMFLKIFFKRDRPYVALKTRNYIRPADTFSFPSGHTSAAFLIATLFSLFYPWTAPLAITWASMVGSSRVILGVHFPSDILSGALFGISFAIVSMAVVL